MVCRRVEARFLTKLRIIYYIAQYFDCVESLSPYPDNNLDFGDVPGSW